MKITAQPQGHRRASPALRSIYRIRRRSTPYNASRFPGRTPLLIKKRERQSRSRRHGLRIPRFAAGGKARSLRRVSSPHATRFAGLARGPPVPQGGKMTLYLGKKRERQSRSLFLGYLGDAWVLTASAGGHPGAPGWPGPAWPGRTGSGCCSWCRPSSPRQRRCRGWWTRHPGCSRS